MAGSTLLLAILKSGDALGVILASSPLVGTFLLHALLRISDNEGSRCLLDFEVDCARKDKSNEH